MAQQRVGVKVKMCGLLAVYLQLLLIGLNHQFSLALFEGHDNVTYLSTDSSIILQSSNFSSTHPTNTSFRYQYVAPLDYFIKIDCEIDLQQGPRACSTEFFYVASDGDLQLRQSEQFCGYGRIQRTSQFRIMTIAYESRDNKGLFQCSITVSPQPCDCGWSMQPRIKNGVEATINAYPNMVALKVRGSNIPSFCGGTIITHRYVLTAAHCLYYEQNANNLIILAGDHRLDSTSESRYAATYNVAQLIPHASYNSQTNGNDIGLLRTTTNIEWSRGVGPICLPFTDTTAPTFNYELATLLGWGTSSFGGIPAAALQKADQMVMTNANCQEEYRGLATIYLEQICTYDYRGKSVDTCQYDSGSPAILEKTRQYSIGIVSFGRGCGYSSYPVGINTRVTAYLDWIQSRIDTWPCRKPLQ